MGATVPPLAVSVDVRETSSLSPAQLPPFPGMSPRPWVFPLVSFMSLPASRSAGNCAVIFQLDSTKTFPLSFFSPGLLSQAGGAAHRK